MTERDNKKDTRHCLIFPDMWIGITNKQTILLTELMKPTIPFAISVFNVQPHDIKWNVYLVHLFLHSEIKRILL